MRESRFGSHNIAFALKHYMNWSTILIVGACFQIHCKTDPAADFARCVGLKEDACGTYITAKSCGVI